jgi:hypothetical protein
MQRRGRAFCKATDRACGFRSERSQAVVLAHAPFVPQNQRMRGRPYEPSPGPWAFSEHMYGIAHCLIDRDGRVIGCNLPIGNGPLLEQAPAVAQILRELVAGASVEQLRRHAARVLERIDTGRAREPGENDE